MFSVTQNGKPLDTSKYIWDEKTKTFLTNENNLVLDFSNYNYCTFNTGSYCTFNTGSRCTFNTGSECIFNTRYNCTFNTEHGCTFNTVSYCTFNTASYCTFNTGKECVCVRRDIFEIIQIPENTKIRLNKYKVKGYVIIPKTYKIVINDKEIELSEESYKNLKKQLIGE